MLKAHGRNALYDCDACITQLDVTVRLRVSVLQLVR